MAHLGSATPIRRVGQLLTQSMKTPGESSCTDLKVQNPNYTRLSGWWRPNEGTLPARKVPELVVSWGGTGSRCEHPYYSKPSWH